MALAKVISIIDHEATKAAQAAVAVSYIELTARIAALELRVAGLRFQVDGLRGGDHADPR